MKREARGLTAGSAMGTAVDCRPNVLLIVSDEHDPFAAGCYGHPFVRTPHLDRLATAGTVFSNAYCNSPLCVPSRLSMLTGRYAHRIGAWDNGVMLRSEIPTIGSYLEAAGYDTLLCGRMHMLGPDRLHGFGRRLVDDMSAWQSFDQMPLRAPEELRNKGDSHVTRCGPGHHAYQRYDRTVAERAVRFLRRAGSRPPGRPWLLVVGFMLPHFPLIAPAELFDLYFPDRVLLPPAPPPVEEQHPAIAQLRRHHCNDRGYPESLLRRALASYYALITLLDQHVGQLLDAVDSSGLLDTTAVIYTSDHGEMGGRHGLWQKMCFYEPSVRVPLILRGSGFPQGATERRNVSLVDLLPTLLDLAGEEPPGDLPGLSLRAPGSESGQERVVFSEYHGQGLEHAAYMIRHGELKYIDYVGHEQPQLFDLSRDPQELHDLSGEQGMKGQIRQLHAGLLEILEPEAVDEQARENQRLFGPARAC